MLASPKLRPHIFSTNSLSGRLHETDREKKDPSVTPRKFKRFFTPRNGRPLHERSGRSTRSDCQRITLSRNNCESSPISGFHLMDSSPDSSLPKLKRRRYNSPDSFSDSSPEKENRYPRRALICEAHIDRTSSPCERATRFPDGTFEFNKLSKKAKQSKRIKTIRSHGLSGQLFERSLGRLSGTTRQSQTYPLNNYYDHTASFCSTPDDVHLSVGLDGQEQTIPFCAVACNTNSLIAVGGEDGRVRLLETDQIENTSLKNVFLDFHIHQNAIIDMSFSSDDLRLVTASGDQTSRVVDMKTQKTISILGVHTASLKQARFQPGSSNNNVIATSSRDGSIQLWDLRCKGYDKPLIEIHNPPFLGRTTESESIHYCAITNSIYDAHKPFPYPISVPKFDDTPRRDEVVGRLGDVSVTAIQFLSVERNHLLLSASEADSSIRLWDIRGLQTSRRRRNQIPISATAQPSRHNKWRNFGISSINLNSDGSRLYTLCKDNTVYVYSTAHLILGHAPDLSSTTKSRCVLNRSVQHGLGPLYGLKHPQFHATSFYVKSAIRKPVEGRCEMLAVGSSDGCAVIFPTDERYILSKKSEIIHESTRSQDEHIHSQDVSISTNGTALIRGHDREVGSLTWTCNGSLATVGDDFLIRVWRESDAAKDLRTGKDQRSKRWGYGWADIDEEYDKDDF